MNQSQLTVLHNLCDVIRKEELGMSLCHMTTVIRAPIGQRHVVHFECDVCVCVCVTPDQLQVIVPSSDRGFWESRTSDSRD